MTNRQLYAASLVGCLVLGYVVAQFQHAVLAAQEAPPAYLIVSAQTHEPDKMGAYRDAAVPLAQQAGLEMVAHSRVGFELLEGEWPYEGFVAIEKFDSMQALKDFWHSHGYEEAKKLRAGIFEANFIVAVEAVE
jgi:uncharacterized protein (DUF1330 family)